MSNRWSIDRTIKFLEIYEQHPCLWDVRLAAYKNRELRKNSYEQIAKAMQLDDFGVLDVRSKIRALRNSYTLELAKILKSKKTAASTEDIYKPKLPWFSVADRFFSKVTYMGEPQLAENDTRLLSENTNDLGIEIKQSPPTLPPPVNQSSLPVPQTQSIPLPPQPSLLERRLRDDFDDDFQNLSFKTSLNGQDDHDVFGAFIANELRGLGNNQSLMKCVKRRIQLAILDAYDAQSNPLTVKEYLSLGNNAPQPLSSSESLQLTNECADDDPIFSAIKCSIIAAERSGEIYKGY